MNTIEQVGHVCTSQQCEMSA